MPNERHKSLLQKRRLRPLGRLRAGCTVRRLDLTLLHRILYFRFSNCSCLFFEPESTKLSSPDLE